MDYFSHILNVKNDGEKEFLRRFNVGMKVVSQYKSEKLLKLSRNLIPLKKLQEEAEKLSKETKTDFKDNLVIGLLKWFKHDFGFKWMNNPPCEKCKSSKTVKLEKNGIPNEFEKEGDCYRVELYNCEKCNFESKFVRYRSVERILKYKYGRCGEWARVFTCFCIAAGFKSRYVMDYTDHVWTEIWSESKNRFVHCDPCENLFDKPMVYYRGWKKKLDYIIGYSNEGVVSLINKYNDNNEDVMQRRTLVSEEWLKESLKSINDYLSKSKEIDGVKVEVEKKDCISEEELQSRISGSLEWKKERGEYHK